MFTVGSIHQIRGILVAATLAFLAACGEQAPTAPVTPTDGEPADLLFFSQPKLLECEVAAEESQTVTIDAAGGTVSIGGTSVVFPAGLLEVPTEVTLKIPASRYVEVEITTNGQNQFPLLKPIVTISYARCNRLDLLFKGLSAWYIDSDTKQLLEKMPSFDNKLTRSVTFEADHFSGYAIAF